jgi:hypothetical protein
LFRPAIMRSRQRHGALDRLEPSFAIKEVYVRGELVASNGVIRGRASGRMVRPSRGVH